MEMFNTTGFEVTDKVQVTIDKETYYGTVLATDSDQNKIQVDYTAKNDKKPVIDWFQCSFWKKLETQKTL